jgi:hypothetical protein
MWPAGPSFGFSSSCRSCDRLAREHLSRSREATLGSHQSSFAGDVSPLAVPPEAFTITATELDNRCFEQLKRLSRLRLFYKRG